MSNLPTQFVFVVGNTNDSPGYKTTSRTLSTVRSHARAYAARNFKQKHKIKRKTNSTEEKVLAPLEKIDDAPEFSLLAASRSADHHPICLLPNDEAASSYPVISITDDLAVSENFPKSLRRVTWRRKQLNLQLPNPRNLLGAGRVDPFQSYPTTCLNAEVHELVDVGMNYVLPGLWPDDHPQHGPDSINSTAKAWFAAGMQSPVLFNLLLWSAGSHRDFKNMSDNKNSCPKALSYKVECIRRLNEVLSGGDKAVTDEVILTVLGLAAHDGVMIHEKRPRPFHSQLKNAGELNFYGAIQYVPEHMKAVTKLVALRGGIDQMSMGGLAESLVIGDICGMENYSTKPLFPPLRFHEVYITSVKEWAKNAANHTSQTAFEKLPPQHGLTADLLEVLSCMKATSLAINYYLEGTTSTMTIGQIVRVRMGVQKRLLWLPAAQDLNIPATASLNMYECCRLTALIFSVAVIFPIPNTHDVLLDLVQRLKTEFERLDIMRLSAQCGKLLLWAVVLGGIAALGKPQRAWYVGYLRFLAMDRFHLHTWEGEGVEEIMEQFLWLESACSPGGQLLWDEVIQLDEKGDVHTMLKWSAACAK